MTYLLLKKIRHFIKELKQLKKIKIASFFFYLFIYFFFRFQNFFKKIVSEQCKINWINLNTDIPLMSADVPSHSLSFFVTLKIITKRLFLESFFWLQAYHLNIYINATNPPR